MKDTYDSHSKIQDSSNIIFKPNPPVRIDDLNPALVNMVRGENSKIDKIILSNIKGAS
jgi:hypothetical protein